jgi:hypothetical protein
MASRSFWATVIFLAVITIGLTFVGRVDPHDGRTVEYSRTTLERLLSETALAAKEVVELEIDALLESVYGPAYSAIPEYATFHYSVLGQYIELSAAVRGQMSDGLYDRIFNGFEQRLTEAASILDQRYVEAYQVILQDQISGQLAVDNISLPLGEITDAVLKDAVARAQVTLPLGTAVAGIVGSGSLKAASATIAAKLATKIATKAAAKGVVKGGTILAGAGGGALLCSWSGPGAVVCGVVGGTAAWFLTDSVVINIDEYFNREDFENDLREILDEDRAQVRDLLMLALENKAAAMDEEMDQVFRLRDL